MIEGKVFSLCKIIKKENYIKSLWKNGQGQTEQIAISPAGANFLTDDFLWRISSAQMESDNQFSIFKNYDRLLTVLSGEGITLNKTVVLPLQVIPFSGDDISYCHLLKNKVTDLGIIFKRSQCKALISLKTFGMGDSLLPDSLVASSDEHLFFCLNGHAVIENQTVQSGDSIYISGSKSLNPVFKMASTFFHIQILKETHVVNGQVIK